MSGRQLSRTALIVAVVIVIVYNLRLWDSYDERISFDCFIIKEKKHTKTVNVMSLFQNKKSLMVFQYNTIIIKK